MTAVPPRVDVPSGAPIGGDGFIQVVLAKKSVRPAKLKWQIVKKGDSNDLNVSVPRPAGDDDTVRFQCTPRPADVRRVPVISGRTTVITIGFNK